jgi:hypothetical protein
MSDDKGGRHGVMERPTYLFQVVRLYSLYNVRDIRTVCRDERNECVCSCRVMSRHGRGMV